MARLLVQARSASVQASLPLAQVKAAAAQVGDLLVTSRLSLVAGDISVAFVWSFCWCLRSMSPRAKHLAHPVHLNDFSLVCVPLCRFRCSMREKDRNQLLHMRSCGVSAW
jgi:hypothetical protein